MIAQKDADIGQTLTSTHGLALCRICGHPVADGIPSSLPSLCQRHAFILARIFELIGNQNRTESDKRRFMEQAEAEASGIFGGIRPMTNADSVKIEK